MQYFCSQQTTYSIGGERVMTTLEKLKWLTDKENGAGIPLKVIAQYAHCHPSSISHFVTEKYEPSPRLEYMLEQGFKEIKKIINEKIGE